MTRGLVRITDEETPVLQALAANVPAGGLIVEIGSAWGYSIVKMAEASKDTVRLIAIDPWTLAPQKQQPERERIFNESAASFNGKIRSIKSFSENVTWIEPIDLLFIDGKHTQKASTDDYLKFSPLLKQSGVLVFHDYHAEAPGVVQTINKVVIPSNEWDWIVQHSLWIGKCKHT